MRTAAVTVGSVLLLAGCGGGKEAACESPAVSPDGSSVAFTRWDDGRASIWVTVDGDEPRAVTISKDVGEFRLETLDTWPAWSADGKEIVFKRTLGQYLNDGSLNVVRVGGDRVRAVTKGMDHSPAWSPDGEVLAFTRSEDIGDSSSLYSVYLWPIHGGSVRRVERENARYPAWSSDGAKLAFADRRGRYLTVLTRKDMKFRTVTRSATSWVDGIGRSSWSPDGTQLVFSDIPSDAPFDRDAEEDELERLVEIFVVNADGTGRTRLTDNDVFDGNPDWAPDGTIVYESDGACYRMNAKGTDGQPLFREPRALGT
jgi:TolB protein